MARPIALAGILLLVMASAAPQAHKRASTWHFAVSGDSRNCGDVIMPAIAAGAKRDGAHFYWHLGDLRMIRKPDEDYVHEPEHRAEIKNDLVLIANYERNAWQDFIQAQIAPFGNMPFFVGIGNHEAITPKNRAEFIQTFSRWLDQPVVRQQRLADDPKDTLPHTYFHWRRDEVDFIYLDNATLDQFSPEQLKWFEEVIHRDESDPKVVTIVAAMHESLPDSLANQHSMTDSEVGKRTGRQVYADLLHAQSKGKNVYVLASHSHYYMSGIFNSEYVRSHGGVLPGWIVGTAGAYRYKLPEHASQASDARANVYGYLLATITPDGHIRFDFKEIKEQDIPPAVLKRYTTDFVHQCFADNHE